MASDPTDRSVDAALQGAIERHRAGQLHEAEQIYLDVLRTHPEHPVALLFLGIVAQQSGRLDDALDLVKRAIVAKPDYAQAHYNLGNIFRLRSRFEDAAASYRRAFEILPAYSEAYNNHGYTLAQMGRFDEAVESYRNALKIDPAYANALNNLGVALREQGKTDEAIACFKQVIGLRPNSAEVLGNLGNAFKDQGRLDEAIDSYRRALDQNPRSADLHNNLGVVFQKLGDIKGAIASFRRAIEFQPRFVEAYRNLLTAILFDPDQTTSAIYAEHRRFAELYAPGGHADVPAFDNARDPDRRLRIGFVSSDFHDHPVARNLMPILANLDRRNFEIFLYAEVANPDSTSQQFKAIADAWRPIVGRTDSDVASGIRDDRIDILFLLAGRFDRNRPLIATYRPAPIQVSLFDSATSGLPSMDYFICDRYLIPRRTTEQFTERPLPLPNFYVHAPILSAPDVAPRPFFRNGYVTFGTCNKPSKINDRVLELWAQVLRANPDSRLLLKYRNQFVSPAVQARVRRIFEAAGIDMARVAMTGETEAFSQHLRTYNDIDIALDPFPFTGSTTTFEALWMGVPVVSLAGERFMARWTASMLRHIGLHDLVASSPAEYVSLASRLAGDRARLSDLSAGLRERLAGSILCDGRRTAGYFGRAMRSIWRRWCARPQASG